MTYVDSVPSFDFRRKLPENRVTKNDIGRICTFSAENLISIDSYPKTG